MLPDASVPDSAHKATEETTTLARFHRLRDTLRAELAAPLPGREAQYRMMPQPREGITFRGDAGAVSYTHLTLPTSDLV